MKDFFLYLGVEKHIRDEESLNCHRADCFIEVVGRWLQHEDGTGDNPHTTLQGNLSRSRNHCPCYAVASLYMCTCTSMCTHMYTHTRAYNIY